MKSGVVNRIALNHMECVHNIYYLTSKDNGNIYIYIYIYKIINKRQKYSFGLKVWGCFSFWPFTF